MLKDLLMAFIALVISLLLVPFVAKLAVKIGAVDKPNARKVHTRIMPRMAVWPFISVFLRCCF